MEDCSLISGPEIMAISRIFKIGTNEDSVFTLSTAGDVQYDNNDENLTEEYQSLWKYIDTIKSSFKFKS